MPAFRQFAKARAPVIGSLRERVIICTTVERPDEDVSTIVKRPGVITVHAAVRPLKGQEVLNWKAVFQTALAPTHEIVIRVPPDVKIDIRHWVFCADRYAETWYRVVTVEDIGGVRRYLALLCTVDTVKDKRSDQATQAPPPVWENPETEPVVEQI